MSDLPFINFTYKSPHEDIENLLGFNVDGSVNVKYTLTMLRNLLLHNVDIVNKLLKNIDHISDIQSIGYGIISAKITSSDILQNLVDENILRENIKELNDSEININEINFIDDTETNNHRLELINNLINDNDFQDEISNHSESDSESSDIICDNDSKRYIIKKYTDLIEENENNYYHDQDLDETNDDCDTKYIECNQYSY